MLFELAAFFRTLKYLNILLFTFTELEKAEYAFVNERMITRTRQEFQMCIIPLDDQQQKSAKKVSCIMNE